MKYGTMAVALTALVVAAACGGSDQPVSPDGVTNPNNPVAGARIGTLHTEKDCTNYFGRAGDSCTITKSNLREIAVGSIVHYLQTANPDLTASGDITLDAGGSNKAFGHCTANLVTGTGLCVFNGGTGKFSSFSARLNVTPVRGVIDAWDGTYSFGR